MQAIFFTGAARHPKCASCKDEIALASSMWDDACRYALVERGGVRGYRVHSDHLSQASSKRISNTFRPVISMRAGEAKTGHV
jgi:hypothetical protein